MRRLLVAGLLGTQLVAAANAAEVVVVEDCEKDFNNWTVTGSAFGKKPQTVVPWGKLRFDKAE